ncbi:MAG: hypothetical protein RLZZ511_2773 [Cyanobacteriota bacterium]
MQLEVTLIGGVVLQHIENKPLFDRLAHGVAMERNVFSFRILMTKGLEGFCFGRGGEGKVGNVRLLARSGQDFIGNLVFDRFFGLGFSSFGKFKGVEG